MPNWIELNNEAQIDEIIEKSQSVPCLIFKHSTRCSISSMAKSRLERKWNLNNEQVLPYYLDLITHRNVSNKIADTFEVIHQSPQVILIKNGKSIYDESHNMISTMAIEEEI